MNILLYLHGNKNVSEKTAELINIACCWKKTAEGKLFVAVSKERGTVLKDELGKWNIDKLFLLENNKNDTSEKTALFLKNIVQSENIDCIIMGNSIFERELAPFLAALYCWKFVPNIIGFEFLDKNILWKRFLYGTKAVQEINTDMRNTVVTISSNIYKKDEREKNIKNLESVIIKNDFKEKEEVSFRVKFREQKILQKHPLESAKIVVGVGKGIKGKENFPMIEELADLLGATIGVTRSVVDNGWRPEYEKIGQTGKIIKPELYLGFGISGAMQHIAGVQQSRHIIMVNNNPNAESFRSSDFGIVADLFDVVPKITEFLKNNKKQK